jgi:hypothetical protein
VINVSVAPQLRCRQSPRHPISRWPLLHAGRGGVLVARWRGGSMKPVAVDPSQCGAIACLGASGEREQLADLPIIRDGRLAWVDGGRQQSLLIGPTAR